MQNPQLIGGSNGANANGPSGVTPFTANQDGSLNVTIAQDNSVVISCDGSGTLTSAGVAQYIFVNTIMRGFGIYNPDPTNDLWINDSGVAVANGAGSIRVAANGGWYETPDECKVSGPISIVGAVNGQKFTAKRW